jgi:phosphoribosylaminoimidazole-succinocarboxamide synthase
MKPIYAGSVKTLYPDADPAYVWFEYTDDYSVFDWGKMPDPIPGKGEALARLGEFFFRELENPRRWEALGLRQQPEVAACLPIRHHFVERQGARLKMLRVEVPRPRPLSIGGTLVYDYSTAQAGDDRPAQRELLPLEVIFRFGVPKGSNLLTRKDWYPFPIHEGAEFAEALVEFSTKLESRDRMLSYQEAALILKGRASLLAQVHACTRAVALFLRALFAQRGLKLWDGKLEWASVDGALCLVDSIGPDELRVSQGRAVLSKQFLRDYYLGSPWEQALGKAKALAKSRATADWKTIVREELKQQPAPLPAPYLAAARALYEDFAALVVDDKPATRFAEAVEGLAAEKRASARPKAAKPGAAKR